MLIVCHTGSVWVTHLPRGLPLKWLDFGGKLCVCLRVCSYSSLYGSVRTGHGVVLHCNLLMSAFLHLVSTFIYPSSESAVLLCWWESPLKFFLITDLASTEGRGAGSVTEHTPKLAVHSRAPFPPHAGSLVTCFLLFFLLLLPYEPISPNSSV